ncbi:unnamed protein product [Auanema sp. JU1783]|nr:unnamed protein product [Auanema sp. JU1783]
MPEDTSTNKASKDKIICAKPYVGSDEQSGSGSSEYLSFKVDQEYIPLHERIYKKIADGKRFFSLEFFPPKTANGVANFLTRIDRFNEGKPMFIDITWHMGSDPANLEKETSSTSIAAACLDFSRAETMLHMTCVQYPKEKTIAHLRQCKELGLRNILALRGDMPTPAPGNEDKIQTYEWCALDMIKWIKEEFGDFFTICCSGYPLGHPEAPTYEADLKYLKAKVDAGAHFVITQLFFEAEVFEKFVKDCRAIGITVPIIPGILPIMGYDSMRRIATLSQLTIPDSIMQDLEPIKHDDDAVRNYGTKRAIEMCQRLLDNGSAPSIHLYTMNREGTCREILKAIGLWNEKKNKNLPWEAHGGNHPFRCKEDVRPIFWSGRPKSYIYRTRDWDEFPNGRWGNSSSPAFGDLKDYYLFHLKGQCPTDELLKMYGQELRSFEDVKQVFVDFITQKPNKNGVTVRCLPWSELDSGVLPETQLICENLLWCNQEGILTINSQPSVNGAPSSDPLVGWGKPGGYCYQKAYLECFLPKEATQAFLEIIFSYTPRINYHVINHDGSFEQTNGEETTPIAVTWGVFPGAEIAQPTVVDPLSFRAWKDEAYAMWIKNWASLYGKDSASKDVIQSVHDNFHLLTLVDNEFMKDSVIFEILSAVIEKVKQH